MLLAIGANDEVAALVNGLAERGAMPIPGGVLQNAGKVVRLALVARRCNYCFLLFSLRACAPPYTLCPAQALTVAQQALTAQPEQPETAPAPVFQLVQAQPQQLATSPRSCRTMTARAVLYTLPAALSHFGPNIGVALVDTLFGGLTGGKALFLAQQKLSWMALASKCESLLRAHLVACVCALFWS